MKNDGGSLDYIQLVIGIIIISIAALATVKTFSHGWKAQDWQQRHKMALLIARSEVETIQATIGSEGPLPRSNERHPLMVMLDKRSPIEEDDIYCDVCHGEITPIDRPETGEGIDYYKFWVLVTWLEPNGTVKREVEFHAAMYR